MPEDQPGHPPTLTQRLAAIERLEAKLVEKAHTILPKGAVNIVDLFIIGVTQRTLSQSTAIRTLIAAATSRRRRFSCAPRSRPRCASTV
ncbi:hypothetical protein [Mesorhizobium sp.]|uniref:hypothetical protein n=1 Tax=Mesorhizobium sp. TaxID=1871066 RepID=UPI00120C926A|nr:hypothetical protein [Mesorhizobium sp.]TIP18448.1 MAG: hypothetical protein E5X66_15830 [Mesorhizobium sp.]